MPHGPIPAIKKILKLKRSSSYAITNNQGRSQDFSKGGAEIMEAKAMKRKNCL